MAFMSYLYLKQEVFLLFYFFPMATMALYLDIFPFLQGVYTDY